MKKMKKINEKRLCTSAAVSFLTPLFCIGMVFADTFDNVVNPVVSLIDSLLNPLLAVVGAVGALYAVLLGVKFAKAEEPQDREKAKQHLKNAVIGFILIFVLILGIKLLMPVMKDWVNAQAKANKVSSPF